MLPTQIISHVVELARTANRDRTPRQPNEKLFSDNWRPTVTPSIKALREYLRGLTEAEVYLLLTIMYVGRKDIAAGDFAAEFERMPTGRTEESALLQLRKPPLADYLDAGMDRLRRIHVDVDQFLG